MNRCVRINTAIQVNELTSKTLANVSSKKKLSRVNGFVNMRQQKQAFDRATFPMNSQETSFQKLARTTGWVNMRQIWKQAFDRTTFPKNSDWV